MSVPTILGANGAPVRTPQPAQCPGCGAGKERRVKSAGFGAPVDVCSKCGFEFPPEGA
jgi:predicted RNA-binding Zn-ribbon protein involved in translation (DUF1610 family)